MKRVAKEGVKMGGKGRGEEGGKGRRWVAKEGVKMGGKGRGEEGGKGRGEEGWQRKG